MRHTKQNDLILEIVNRACNHPTAYDVYNECRKEIPNISLGTVYRNLNKLVELGLIQRLDVGGDMIKYDKNINHDHFVCVKCCKVIDLDRSNISYDEQICGNKVINCIIRYDGICRDCLELEKESRE